MSRDSIDGEKERLLALLEAHGQGFLSSFGALPESNTQPSRKRRKVDHDGSENSEDEVREDECTEFSSDSSNEVKKEESDVDYSDEVDENGDEDYDDDFRSDQLPKKQPDVVVFSDTPRSTTGKMSKSQAKALMSSKVSRLRQEPTDMRPTGEDDDHKFEEERTNLQNDKLLHKLVHTQLLSGSLDSELNLTPAQRRKALEGRVLELAASAKLGKGESIVKQEERKKAAKRVRLGLERKVEERRRKALEEAKDLGNYHHSIKRLFEDDNNKHPDRRKRDRGLKLGVGRFSGGVLKLSKDDVASVQGNAGPARGTKTRGPRGARR